jgi:hypothetical protein
LLNKEFARVAGRAVLPLIVSADLVAFYTKQLTVSVGDYVWPLGDTFFSKKGPKLRLFGPRRRRVG